MKPSTGNAGFPGRELARENHVPAVYHFGPRWPRIVTVQNLPATQTPVAQQSALNQAAPNSTAEIVAVNPRGRTLTEVLTTQPQRADFMVQIRPLRPELAHKRCEQLKKAQ